jgi:hypothetical protein
LRFCDVLAKKIVSLEIRETKEIPSAITSGKLSKFDVWAMIKDGARVIIESR